MKSGCCFVVNVQYLRVGPLLVNFNEAGYNGMNFLTMGTNFLTTGSKSVVNESPYNGMNFLTTG